MTPHPVPKVGDTVVLNDNGLEQVFGRKHGLAHMKTLRMKVTHVSSLLKRLSEARLLRSSPHPDDKRTNRYVISEGFFDLWLYMNLSRGARTRLPFLFDFFALFYPSLLEREKKRGELLGCLGTE